MSKLQGRILSASPRTIQNHVRNILRKLNTETRTGAVLEAIESHENSEPAMSIGILTHTLFPVDDRQSLETGLWTDHRKTFLIVT
jgi:Bacterial regulatory proteins, luxR family